MNIFSLITVMIVVILGCGEASAIYLGRPGPRVNVEDSQVKEFSQNLHLPGNMVHSAEFGGPPSPFEASRNLRRFMERDSYFQIYGYHKVVNAVVQVFFTPTGGAYKSRSLFADGKAGLALFVQSTDDPEMVDVVLQLVERTKRPYITTEMKALGIAGELTASFIRQVSGWSDSEEILSSDEAVRESLSIGERYNHQLHDDNDPDLRRTDLHIYINKVAFTPLKLAAGLAQMNLTIARIAQNKVLEESTKSQKISSCPL